MDVKKTGQEFLELKQSYDRARTSYEIAAKELEAIDKELAKKGLTVKTLDGAIAGLQESVSSKERKLEKMMEKLRGIVAKARASQG